jgi:2-dehydropantoate 2-reductase
MAMECIRVAVALGIDLPFDPMYLVKKFRSGEVPLSKHAGSMAQDIEAARETELEAMTGYIVRKARELGVPVPITESVYRMAKGVEFAVRVKRGGG